MTFSSLDAVGAPGSANTISLTSHGSSDRGIARSHPASRRPSPRELLYDVLLPRIQAARDSRECPPPSPLAAGACFHGTHFSDASGGVCRAFPSINQMATTSSESSSTGSSTWVLPSQLSTLLNIRSDRLHSPARRQSAMHSSNRCVYIPLRPARHLPLALCVLCALLAPLNSIALSRPRSCPSQVPRAMGVAADSLSMRRPPW